ncbi:MAG: class I SAM-dependent methyltransferase [Oscillatoria sp. Prado101]|jgi:SAM-dependent methyltransferase|nr:class I SAM-dependent methyltransferase [Oscillatoria sp. Prado101]
MPISPTKQILNILRQTWRQLHTKRVPFDRLLCGGEDWLSAAQYARHTGNCRRPSTPFSQSPHVKLLEQYQQIGDEIFRPDVFQKTAYFANAVECMRVTGHYFSCTRPEQVEQVARRFVSRLRNEAPRDSTPLPSAYSAYFSSTSSQVCVHPIQHSNCYEVMDGNHRLALAYVRGEKTYPVRPVPPAVLTPLQERLLEVGWLRGEFMLYQPISSPELGKKWVLMRRCSDRFEMMQRFLETHNLMPPQCRTYLDVPCGYGWFVRAFSQLGFDARGVDVDWACIEAGKVAYGLAPAQLIRSEAVHFLQSHPGRYDVTSCLSLLHRFFFGEESVSAEEMLRLLDEITGSVLFLDMGQGHEAPFRDSLAGWDADRIEEWLREKTSFTKICRLGTDSDSVPPFADRYGRTLFACLR